MKYRLFLIKRWIEDVLMFPLIMLGRIIAINKPLLREYRYFYFFPFYHTGGAEKVHALIAQATGNENCIIFFTRKSHNDGFLELFQSSGCYIKDVSKYTDNKWLYPVNILFRGIISGYINRQKLRPVVFNGQANFGYKISPWISKKVPQLELIHSVSNFSFIRIPFLPFITRTVMISTVKIKEHIDIYKRYHIPLNYQNRIQFIMNAIDLPKVKPSPKEKKQGFNILYVGRGTPEKRVHLIAQMAERLHQNAAIHFQFMGDVEDAIPENLRQYCHFFGNVSEEQQIGEIYNEADVLLLVSDTEGFPMVVMEAMARGLPIVATAVGELPLHIKADTNGHLITDYRNEDKVIEESVKYILKLTANSELFSTISAYNIDYAYQHFGMDRFRKEYRSLFEEAAHQSSSA